jgi:hypothetical protein
MKRRTISLIVGGWVPAAPKARTHNNQVAVEFIPVVQVSCAPTMDSYLKL